MPHAKHRTAGTMCKGRLGGGCGYSEGTPFVRPPRYSCQYSHDNIGHYYCLVERVSACAEPPAAVVTPSAEAHSRAAAAHNRTNRGGIGLRHAGHVRTSVRGDANFSAVSVYGCEGYTLPDRCDGSGRVGSGRLVARVSV
jgi:hypothetical protein